MYCIYIPLHVHNFGTIHTKTIEHVKLKHRAKVSCQTESVKLHNHGTTFV